MDGIILLNLKKTLRKKGASPMQEKIMHSLVNAGRFQNKFVGTCVKIPKGSAFD